MRLVDGIPWFRQCNWIDVSHESVKRMSNYFIKRKMPYIIQALSNDKVRIFVESEDMTMADLRKVALNAGKYQRSNGASQHQMHGV